MNAFAMIGLPPHDFADPYTTWDVDHESERCGVRTPQGSPCGYPRSMHVAASHIVMSPEAYNRIPASWKWPDPLRAPGTDDEFLGLQVERPNSGMVVLYLGAALVVVGLGIGFCVWFFSGSPR